MGTNRFSNGYYKGINPLDILVLKIPITIRKRVFSLLTLISCPKMTIQRVNSITLGIIRVMGTNGYYKGINPIGNLMGNGYPPYRGYPYTLYPYQYLLGGG